ncbi:hypothetical protein [Pseudooceanicola sp.]|uniref:hypothetical protein n=1 Tax=Pseudooceanicola sp. TaxID=1914328 RepID=UPI0026189811|nr:hypothetical protein [Pseudooceanicola sp.]MDF1856911.1 hypothetical protein [Pseudooceanicola sp.]
MIIANLATYPLRQSNLMPVVHAIAPQVDRLNVVLNQYDTIPEELLHLDNVVPVIPDHDTKDVGKFYPDVSGADYVFMIDDDIIYPADFIAATIREFEALGPGRFLGGYHGSVYYKPGPSLNFEKLTQWFSYDPVKIADYRRVYGYDNRLARATITDQIATNAAIMRGADFPPYDYMRDSQKFVDVRLARWCHERGILPVALPRSYRWMKKVPFEETIHRGFTKTHPAHVADEIWTFAFKTEGVGQPWIPKT